MPPQDAARAGTAPSVTAAMIGVAAATLALEGLIGLAAVRGNVAVGWLLVGHLAVVGALAAWVQRYIAAGHEASAALLLLLLTFAAGPVGALGAVLTLPFLGRRETVSPLLAAWYERISMSTAVDPEAKLAESILSGRTLEAAAPPPARLHGIMLRGTLVERQKALGLIARRFDPVYASALQAALKSPEPVVRVQAAAVAARVRGSLKSDVRAMLARLAELEASPGEAARAAARLEGFARSGLLDEGDRVRAEAAVTRLRGAILARAAGSSGDNRPATTGIADAPTRPITRLPRSLAAAREIERALVASGRFRELRVARRVDALARRGFSVRPRSRRSMPAAGASIAATSSEAVA